MKELKCKSMKWYVETVDLELGWEADKVCIPNAHGNPSGCAGPAAHGRATIDRTMDPNEWDVWAKKSEYYAGKYGRR